MRNGQRRVFWLLLVSGLTAFALAMAYRWFERGGAFDLKTVRVRGIREADSSVVCRAVAPLFGRSIWRIDLSALEDSLESIPGIDSVHVSRVPLGEMIIQTTLSTPAYALKYEQEFFPVSSTGEQLPRRFFADSLPLVETIDSVDAEVLKNLADWFAGQDFSTDTLSFALGDSGLSVTVEERYRVLLGSGSFQDRWNGYIALQQDLLQPEDFYRIDMRFKGQAVIRTNRTETPGTETDQ